MIKYLQAVAQQDDKTSRHYVSDINIYESSFNQCFTHFFGKPEDYLILALLPSYLEREDSSLVYMTKNLIEKSKYKSSGFYLDNYNELLKTIESANKPQTILLGVTFAIIGAGRKIQSGSFRSYYHGNRRDERQKKRNCTGRTSPDSVQEVQCRTNIFGIWYD